MGAVGDNLGTSWRQKQDNGQNYIKRSFKTRNLHRVLLGRRNVMGGECGRHGSEDKYMQGFLVLKTQ